MINVLIASHGLMADGMLNSVELFFGENPPKVSSLCMLKDDDPAAFKERIREKVDADDDGSGTIIFCDLLGGTPANQCAFLLQDPSFASHVKVITGMNLSLLVEVLGLRLSTEKLDDIDIKALLETNKEAVICLNDYF